MRMPLEANRFECLVTREWHYLKGLGSVDLLEEVCHWEWTLRFSKAQARPSGCLLLDTEFSATSLAPCLPVCHHAPSHDSELNL